MIEAELANLSDDDREELLAAKDRFAEILDEGLRVGAFDADRPATASRAIATLCASVSSWYVSAGVASPRQIA